MTATMLLVFVIGLRHGADPDHLAAIDNLTRNANERMPRTSRFVGTLFALGHSTMALALAGVAALLGTFIGRLPVGLERVGDVASIAVLISMVGLNIRSLAGSSAKTFRSRLLPKWLRDATHPLIAIPTGALFGMGFETSSQLVAYGAAFSSSRLTSGLEIGAAFCLGMICTDTVDSLLVARVVTAGKADGVRARRLWIGAVTIIAVVVAGKKIADICGVPLPLDELTLSAATVCLLLLTLTVIAAGKYFRVQGDAQSAAEVAALM